MSKAKAPLPLPTKTPKRETVKPPTIPVVDERRTVAIEYPKPEPPITLVADHDERNSSPRVSNEGHVLILIDRLKALPEDANGNLGRALVGLRNAAFWLKAYWKDQK